MNYKLTTITNLFDEKGIRGIRNSKKEGYYLSIIIVNALSESEDY